MEIKNREAALAEERKKEELKEENVFEVKEEEPVKEEQPVVAPVAVATPVSEPVSEPAQPTEVTQSIPVQVDESQPVAMSPPVENDDDDLSDDSDL